MMKQRQCVILQGERDWCQSASQILLEGFDNNNIISLSVHTDDAFVILPQKQAKKYLGKEFDAVVFDGLDEFNLDSFGIIVGTVKQGGAIIIWLSPNCNVSLSMQRFMRVVAEFEQQHEHFTVIQQGQVNQWGLTRLICKAGSGSESLTRKSIESDPIDCSNEIVLTDDQRHAVSAILKVVHGHRRRPLVLSADRGRGKSASLGVAAAQLLSEGKQRIIVTAPSLATVEAVFEHAKRCLPNAISSDALISWNNAEIRFVSPDVLIESEYKADLVLVDEAAAIPAAMLEKLLQQYSRIVFSTTLHGYEGTGRGFAVRFQKSLEQRTPHWHHYQMETPIRWAENDMLEAFSFKSLLLNAMPVNDDLISDAKLENCHFEYLDRRILIDNEQELKELFGLMVLAHYRTRPSDLQMMCDRDDVSVYVMRYQGHIVASAWLVKEGELDDELSSAIYAGQRRLKGHLLPQSLLAHAGIQNAGGLSYQRVIRIATHPAIQQRGVAKDLLAKIISHVDADIVGTSFGICPEVINFWSQSGFMPARLGIYKDDVSGSHSLMMLKANSAVGLELASATTKRFQQHWPQLLQSQFSQLDTALVIQLSQLLPRSEFELSLSAEQEIIAFSQQQRGYEFSQIALWKYVSSRVRMPDFLLLSIEQQRLCVMVVLQQRDWADVSKHLRYTGKSQLIKALRNAISSLWTKV